MNPGEVGEWGGGWGWGGRRSGGRMGGGGGERKEGGILAFLYFLVPIHSTLWFEY